MSEELQNATGYELDNAIATKATRRFLERYRKKNKKSLKHWLITEIGHEGTENIHMHGIIWIDDINDIQKYWNYGHTWTGHGEQKINYVTNRTINYMIKYVTKIDSKHKEYQPKILCSPGIGKNYSNIS